MHILNMKHKIAYFKIRRILKVKPILQNLLHYEMMHLEICYRAIVKDFALGFSETEDDDYCLLK